MATLHTHIEKIKVLGVELSIEVEYISRGGKIDYSSIDLMTKEGAKLERKLQEMLDEERKENAWQNYNEKLFGGEK